MLKVHEPDGSPPRRFRLKGGLQGATCAPTTIRPTSASAPRPSARSSWGTSRWNGFTARARSRRARPARSPGRRPCSAGRRCRRGAYFLRRDGPGPLSRPRAGRGVRQPAPGRPRVVGRDLALKDGVEQRPLHPAHPAASPVRSISSRPSSGGRSRESWLPASRSAARRSSTRRSPPGPGRPRRGCRRAPRRVSGGEALPWSG